MEVAEVRRRLRAALDRSRREAAARRERSDAASRAYEEFLRDRAVPVFHALASALAGEGRRFKVETPARSVRLASENERDSFLELVLDETQDPPAVLARTSRGRGRRQITSERSFRPAGPEMAALTEEDVLDFTLEELLPLLER